MRDSTRFAPEREVRFALVMYGGISLAIYMNGIAQEFLNLVRSTSEDPNKPGTCLDLTSWPTVCGVYRDVARALNDRKTISPPVRFVVDIISGTSAGGLNGVFLAKALACDEGMDSLQNLWIQEGDIGKLLNDRQSYEDLDLKKEGDPRSLLNSQRMYAVLLKALHEMGCKKADGTPVTKLADELDLYVTTTDLIGLPTPIYLSDEEAPNVDSGASAEDLEASSIPERRYRNVFHFRYAIESIDGEPRNDFQPQYVPFLAFAGRCTSSIVPAFEPMRLIDTKVVLDSAVNPSPSQYRYENTRDWENFYSDYWRNAWHYAPWLSPYLATKKAKENFEYRSFGDGGYLDNKPFSFATATLTRRRANLPVDRKLVYIEPDPEKATKIARNQFVEDERTDVLSHASAAFSLPQVQPIRDDISAIRDRNDLLQKAWELIDLADDTGAKAAGAGKESPIGGLEYEAYLKVRLQVTIDYLAGMLRRVLGFEEDSPYLRALRLIVEAWVEQQIKNRTLTPTESEPQDARKRRTPSLKATEDFLKDFDVEYRIRENYFVQRTLSEALKHRDSIKDQDPTPQQALALRLSEETLRNLKSGLNNIATDIFRRSLLVDVRKQINAFLETDPASPASPTDANRKPLTQALMSLGIRLTELGWILKPKSHQGRIRRAKIVLGLSLTEGSDGEKSYGAGVSGRPAILNTLAAELSQELRLRDCEEQLEQYYKTIDTRAAAALKRLFQDFPVVDALTFPLTVGAGASESREVDVLRLSPLECDSLYSKLEDRSKKLYGTRLGHFGAFFNEQGRKRDILWGRFDAAERIIHSLLPDDESTRRLVAQAQLAILADSTFLDEDRKLANCQETRQSLVKMVLDSVKQPIEVLYADFPIDKQRVLDELNVSSAGPLQPVAEQPTETSAMEITRGIGVVGHMLDGLSFKYKLAKKPATWLIRLSQLLWTVVELSAPDSLLRHFGRHWLGIGTVLGALMTAIGVIAGKPDVTALGVEILVGCLVLLLLSGWLCLYMSPQPIFRAPEEVLRQKPSEWKDTGRFRLFRFWVELSPNLNLPVRFIFQTAKAGREEAELPTSDHLALYRLGLLIVLIMLPVPIMMFWEVFPELWIADDPSPIRLTSGALLVGLATFILVEFIKLVARIVRKRMLNARKADASKRDWQTVRPYFARVRYWVAFVGVVGFLILQASSLHSILNKPKPKAKATVFDTLRHDIENVNDEVLSELHLFQRWPKPKPLLSASRAATAVGGKLNAPPSRPPTGGTPPPKGLVSPSPNNALLHQAGLPKHS